MKRIVKPTTPTVEVDKFWARKFNLTSFLFDKQLAFVEDPAPFKVAVCSRRSGKTVACVAHLMHTAINNKDSVCLYITLAGTQAKRNVWREVKKLNKQFDLNGKLNEIELSISFQNGAIVYLAGASDSSEIEKFRGLAIKLCYIDECQSFKAYIKDLIDDVIAPALMDYAGSLCLIGTPGPVPSGYFHECYTADNAWSKHHWTFWDNPFLVATAKMTHQQMFERDLKRRGVLATDPSVQREWYGKWILDEDSLLIHYNPNLNHYDALIPGIQYNYIMGIDVGFNDADAISILAWSDKDPNTYLVEELITTKQGLTPLVKQINDLNAIYKVSKMIMDFGGIGKKMGEEMIKYHSIPVEPADKVRKMENIELLNDSLRTGKFKAKAKSRFAQDSYLVEIDRDKSTPDRIKVSNSFHSDIIDSVLYAFKASYGFSYTPPVVPPKYGTKAWADAQDTAMWELELQGHIEADELKKRGENDGYGA